MEKTIALTSGVLGPDEVQELQKLVTNGITVTLLLPKTSSFNNINLRLLSELGLKVNIGLEQTYQDLLVCMGDNTIGGFYNSETVSSLSKINPDHIKSYIFESSIMYMIYWHNRLVSKVDKQRELRSSLINYIGKHGNQEQTERIVDMWLHDEQLIKESESYVERRLLSKKTVDLVILQGKGDQKKVLCMQRDWFPEGMALPGGFILDSDEDNELGLDPFMFAALRIGSTKVLHSSNLIYGNDSDENGHKFYFVADKRGNRLKLYSHKSGYHYTDRLQNMIEPSDPRHLVDTIGYELEYEGESLNDLERKDKKDIMDSKIQKGGLVFGHQREIIAHLSSRTSIDDLKGINHPEWIRNIIKNPLDSYKSLQERFKANNNSPETSMPELFPIVFTMKKNLFSEKYNNLCKSNPILNGVRLSVYNTLEHVSFQNRILCPYSSTIRAILSCIDFFDMCVRLERGFYNELDNDKFTHQDPTKINNAFYHTYRYEYLIRYHRH